MISPVCAPEGFLKSWRGTTLFEVTALLLGISLPVSNVLMNICFALALLCLILQRDTQTVFIVIKQPMVWLPLLMFALLALSLLIHPHSYGLEMAGKYKKLLYVFPLALFFRHQPLLVRRFVVGFLLANAVILILSLGAGLLHIPLGHIDPLNPTVFKRHITQNFFMALSALIWLSLAFAHPGVKRCGYGLLVLTASYDVLFLVLGRTGYVALIVGLGICGVLSLKSWQRLAVVTAGVLAICLLVTVPNRAYQRIALGVNEIHNCLANVDNDSYASCETSMGQRTGFALTSLKLIKQAPLFGNGAGSFWYGNPETGYSIHNPHNQYLLETVQSGAVGLALFLGWMLCCYRTAWRYSPPIRNLLIALLSGYMTCHLFNSFLLDSAEGHLFVIIAAILASESCNPDVLSGINS
jgi:O-antigen ligase